MRVRDLPDNVAVHRGEEGHVSDDDLQQCTFDLSDTVFPDIEIQAVSFSCQLNQVYVFETFPNQKEKLEEDRWERADRSLVDALCVDYLVVSMINILQRV
ncbi:hypothetical protein Tco_0425846 [Tanacetum coccineum]